VRVVGAARRSGADIVILDRYIYDELANLPVSNILTKIFIRMVSGFVPTPDVAYLLDVAPEAARGRKPEYPVEFLHLCRQSYFGLALMLGNMTIIPPVPLREAEREVENTLAVALSRRLLRRDAKLDTVPAA
jgi:thymidylate kinase